MDLLALHAELANTTSSFGPNGHHAPEELGVAGPPPPLVPKIPPVSLKLQRSLHNHSSRDLRKTMGKALSTYLHA